jgi:hypothetical protein
MNDKTIIYYTCNTHKPEIDDLARSFLGSVGLPIISVSLNKEIDFGDTRIVIRGERSPLTMHRQILNGLEACTTNYAFLAESDVLYHPSHFEFMPQEDTTFYFNVNVWKQRWPDNYFIRTDNSQQLSGMSAYTRLMRDWFHGRRAEIEADGFNRHYEPRDPRENYSSEVPNICIRHDKNLTKSKWSIADYRNKEYAKGWTEATNVPGWNTKF